MSLIRNLKLSMMALATTSFISLSSAANAADFGGDCCADLEERVANLEAQTVRKGNRKVSLQITGWVFKQLMYWDDGNDSDVYVVDQLPDLTSRVSFLGTANITSNTKVGYQITLALDTADAYLVTQNNDDAGTGISMIHSYMYVEDKTYGKLSMGFLQHASDNTTFDIDRSGTIFPSNQVLFEGTSMLLRASDGIGAGYANGANWGMFVTCESIQFGISVDCAGNRRNAVRYDTPSLGGLVLSASWGEDDFWDVKAVYNKDFGRLQLGLSASYTDSSDQGNGPAEVYQAGLYLKDTETGLFALATYNEEEAGIAGRPDGTGYYIKAGIARKINSLGTTYLYGEVGQGFDQYGLIADAGAACAAFNGIGGAISNACASGTDTSVSITDSKFTRLGIVLQQDIEAAAMTTWIKYMNYSLEADFLDTKTGNSGRQDFEDLNLVILGASIFF